MDKFVIKTKRKPVTIAPATAKVYKQGTLESLRGVVVIEKISKAKKILTSKSTSQRQKLYQLRKLSEKRPCEEVLKSTGIGRTVQKLSQSEDSEVAKLATRLHHSWKSHLDYLTSRTSLDVKYDFKTEQLRDKARNMMMDAINQKKENIASNSKEFSISIEQELFYKCEKKTSYSYRRTVRKIVFTMKNQDSIANQLLDNRLTVGDIVNTFYQP